MILSLSKTIIIIIIDLLIVFRDMSERIPIQHSGIVGDLDEQDSFQIKDTVSLSLSLIIHFVDAFWGFLNLDIPYAFTWHKFSCVWEP